MNIDYMKIILKIVITLMVMLYVLIKSNILHEIINYEHIGKRDKNHIKYIRYSIIFFMLFIPGVLIYNKNFIVGIILFVINVLFCKTIMKILNKNDNELISEIYDFINILIKEFSTKDNLIDILQVALDESDGVLIHKVFNPIFNELLISQNNRAFDHCLENTNNMWIISLIQIIKDYTKDSNKEKVIANLEMLYTTIETAIEIANDTKSKLNILLMTSEILFFIGIVGGIANLILNKYFTIYLFQTVKGMGFMFIMNILIFMTFVIISKMIKGFDIE